MNKTMNKSMNRSGSKRFKLAALALAADRAQLAQATQAMQLAAYEKTVQTAFREVADALAARATFAERLAGQQELVDASGRDYTLVEASWKGGASSYLEVLVAQRALYASQQTLITLLQAEQANRVTLFKVLGGGWQERDGQAGPAAG